MAIDWTDPDSNLWAHFGSEEAFRISVGRVLVNIAESINSKDGEILLMCDDQGGGTVVQFLRTYITDQDDNLVVTDTTLDGTTPYVVVGTAEKCDDGAGAGADNEIVILCDNDGAGNVTKFLRHLRFDAGVITKVDTELDGTTGYAVTGTVEVCECTLKPTAVIKDYELPEGAPIVNTYDTPTGAPEALAVPAGASSMTITAWGAGGGATTTLASDGGGNAGFARGTFAPQPLEIRLGTGGIDKETVSPYPGGGAGGTDAFAATNHGSSGGGYSGVFDTTGLIPLVIAGGGGGSAGAPNGGGGGGHGGGTAGTIGGSGGGVGGDNVGGGGGTQVAGGAGGTAVPPQGPEAGSAGASLAGGTGGTFAGPTGGGAGGGGGGGYFGGGGGASHAQSPSEDDSGGGGGSGYVDPIATGISLIAGSGAGVANTGDPLYNGTAGAGALSLSAARGGAGLIVVEWAIGGAGSRSKAILWESCDGTIREWRDCVTGTVVDEAHISEEALIKSADFAPRSELDYTLVVGTFVELMSAIPGTKYVEVFNTTDRPLIVSFDGGTTEHQYLGAAEGRTYELARDGLTQDASIHVKHAGVAPTVGAVRGSRYK